MERDGFIELKDGARIRFRTFIIEAKEAGFSPYGGVRIIVNLTGGMILERVPEEIKELLKDKPVAPLEELPRDGWEIIEIKKFETSINEFEVDTSKGKFIVKVETEPIMVARNNNYRSNPFIVEPLYVVEFIHKISWKPKG